MLDIYNKNDLNAMSWSEQIVWWKVDIPWMLRDYQIAWDFQ